MENIPNVSTGMKIEGEYHEGQNDYCGVRTRKLKEGMNFPCPESSCILTFNLICIHVEGCKFDSV